MISIENSNDKSSYLLFEKLLEKLQSTKFDQDAKNNLISDFVISTKKVSFPIKSGNEVYFIYIGKAKIISVVGDFNSWDIFDKTSQMINIPYTDLFYLQKDFDVDARLDYQFVVDTKWILDPLNENKILGGFGNNSELKMPKYNGNNIDFDSEYPKGSIEKFRFKSQIQKKWSREIAVYLPPNYDSNNPSAYPSIYAVDGSDYLGPGMAPGVLDYYIGTKKIPPVICIFIDPVSGLLRLQDFNNTDCNKKFDKINNLSRKSVCRQKYCEFLIKELVPFIDKKYNTRETDPKYRAHIGVSIGGQLSVFIASEYPDLFKLIGSQSGAFWVDSKVYEKFSTLSTVSDMKFYLNAGTFEKRNHLHTKKFAHILEKKNYNYKSEYFHQGHSWGLWKFTFGKMLEYLFSNKNN